MLLHRGLSKHRFKVQSTSFSITSWEAGKPSSRRIGAVFQVTWSYRRTSIQAVGCDVLPYLLCQTLVRTNVPSLGIVSTTAPLELLTAPASTRIVASGLRSRSNLLYRNVRRTSTRSATGTQAVRVMRNSCMMYRTGRQNLDDGFEFVKRITPIYLSPATCMHCSNDIVPKNAPVGSSLTIGSASFTNA